MKAETIHLDGENRNFPDGVIQQEIHVGASLDVSLFFRRKERPLRTGKYFQKRHMGNRREMKLGNGF